MAPRGRPTQAQLMAMKAKEPLDVRRMYEMRIKGMSIHRIAEAFNTSSSYVHKLMEKYAKAELVPFVEEYRQLQLERLEFLWQKLVSSGRLEKGDPAALNAGTAILKRLSDNLGLDAPTKLELETKIDPKEIELHSLILEAQRRARGEIKAIKGEATDEDDEDIVDAEVVDEEE